MTTASEQIAVIGGGLTGLVAAYELRHNPPWPDVVLFESDTRLGGKISTLTHEGVTIEEGADSFLIREPDVVELCRDLGIEGELIRPAVFGAQIYTGGALHPLPQGFLRGVPTSVRAALRTGILTTPGALRAAADLMWPRRLTGPDVSFGGFVARHFGREVLDKLVAAVMSGTRAGVPEQVSLAAGAAEIDAIARRDRSVMRGLKKLRLEGALESGPPPFRSFGAGMERLVERLAEHLGSVEMKLGASVDRIEVEGDGYSIVTGAERRRVSAAIVTTAAHDSARILQSAAPQAARELEQIEYSSSASITLVYPPETETLPTGSGLLIPARERKTLSACTWFSRKWPHHAPADGTKIVRAFVGSANTHDALERTDDELVELAHRELAEIAGLEHRPVDARVKRWERSLPQYAVGHLQRVDRIERALKDQRIFVAGAGLRGSGIPDCVRQGRLAAAEAVASK